MDVIRSDARVSHLDRTTHEEVKRRMAMEGTITEDIKENNLCGMEMLKD